MHHRFLVRGAIAYGPVIQGGSVQSQANWTLDAHDCYRKSVLLGLPMTQAYYSESEAPPFGIAIDDSARAFAPEGEKPFSFIWWDWFTSVEPPLDTGAMLEGLKKYFDWHHEFTNTSGYRRDRITEHRQLAQEFFGK